MTTMIATRGEPTITRGFCTVACKDAYQDDVSLGLHTIGAQTGCLYCGDRSTRYTRYEYANPGVRPGDVVEWTPPSKPKEVVEVVSLWWGVDRPGRGPGWILRVKESVSGREFYVPKERTRVTRRYVVTRR